MVAPYALFPFPVIVKGALKFLNVGGCEQLLIVGLPFVKALILLSQLLKSKLMAFLLFLVVLVIALKILSWIQFSLKRDCDVLIPHVVEQSDLAHPFSHHMKVGGEDIGDLLRPFKVLCALDLLFGPLDIPSYLLKAGDVVAVKDKSKTTDEFKSIVESNASRPVPQWVDVNKDAMEAKIVKLPDRDEIATPVEEHLIVEFYSK